MVRYLLLGLGIGLLISSMVFMYVEEPPAHNPSPDGGGELVRGVILPDIHSRDLELSLGIRVQFSLPESDEIRFYIEPGARVIQIAARLEEKGLIPDGEDFLGLLIDRGLDRLVIAGEYYFSPGIEEEEIIRQLTAQP